MTQGLARAAQLPGSGLLIPVGQLRYVQREEPLRVRSGVDPLVDAEDVTCFRCSKPGTSPILVRIR